MMRIICVYNKQIRTPGDALLVYTQNIDFENKYLFWTIAIYLRICVAPHPFFFHQIMITNYEWNIKFCAIFEFFFWKIFWNVHVNTNV